MKEKNNWEEELYDDMTDKRKMPDIKKIIIILLVIALIGLTVAYFLDRKTDDKITFNLITENIQLKVGEKRIIQYEVTNQTAIISFSSSDNSIANVNQNGVIEGLHPGKTYILVSYNYNGIIQGKKCNVEVLDEEKNNLPSCSLKVYSDGKIVATPVNATKYGFSETYKNGNEIEYQFISEKVVGVTKFDILPILYYVENSEGEKATCSVVIEMTCQDLTSDCTFKGI